MRYYGRCLLFGPLYNPTVATFVPPNLYPEFLTNDMLPSRYTSEKVSAAIAPAEWAVIKEQSGVVSVLWMPSAAIFFIVFFYNVLTATAWLTITSHTKERFLRQTWVDRDPDTTMFLGFCLAAGCRSLARVLPIYCFAVLSPRLPYCFLSFDVKLPWNG